MDDSLNTLESIFLKYQENYDDFFTIENDKQLVERIQFELSLAKTEIIFDFWAEEIDWFRDSLIKGEKRGLRVMGSVLGKVELPIKTVFVDQPEKNWQERLGRIFSLLIDRKVTILGICHPKYATNARLTKHPSMAGLLFNNFYHDVVIHEITNDFRSQLEQKYGRNFEHIIQKYFSNSKEEN
jgi:HTH-type transcriptional regulator, sugar sensing transcriptional regulator